MDLYTLQLRISVVSIILAITHAQKESWRCIDQQQTIRPTCGNGNIYSMNLTSWTIPCGEIKTNDDVCNGKTPSLLVNQLNCFWQHDCVIQLPSDPIIMTQNTTCFGKYGESVVSSYRCLQPSDYILEGSKTEAEGRDKDVANKIFLLDICSNMINGSSVQEISAGYPSMSGVIRSHPLYPWGYSPKQRNCSLKIAWPRRQKLVYTIHDIHLDEGDTLIIGDKDPSLASSGTYELKKEELSFFNFTVGNESRGADGYVICFKFIPMKHKADADVCESITEPGVDFVAATDDTSLNTPGPDKSISQSGTNGTPGDVATEDTVPEMPPRCRKKKTAKAQKRCMKKMADKKAGKKNKRRKKDKKPKDKNNKKKRKSKKNKSS